MVGVHSDIPIVWIDNCKEFMLIVFINFVWSSMDTSEWNVSFMNFLSGLLMATIESMSLYFVASEFNRNYFLTKIDALS